MERPISRRFWAVCASAFLAVAGTLGCGDNTLTVQKGGSWIDKQSLELKAFHNEEDGQAYSNLDSVVQNFFVTWNYIYTGTPWH